MPKRLAFTPHRIPSSLRALRGLHLTNLAQLSAAQVGDLVRYAHAIKYSGGGGGGSGAGDGRGGGGAVARSAALRGKTIALLFADPSTRTRLALHTAVTEEGGSVIDLGQGTHLGAKETLADTVRTVTQFCSLIAYRGVAHESFEAVCRHATIPVVNALTARYHPTQALADLLTIYEQFGDLRGVRLAYLGDCDNNVARSLALAAVQCGLPLTLAAPAGYELDDRTVSLCEAIAADHRQLPVQTADPAQAVRAADVVYTDVWYSMGDEAEKEQRRRALAPYKVTAALLGRASERAIFMHCLPANRNDEVSDEVLDSERSVVWRQAGNRRHIFKALLRAILRNGR